MIHLLNGLHRTTLTFIDKTLEHGDTYSLRFTPGRPFRHIAGQHAGFYVPGAGFHVFSLASSPNEGFVMIGTHLREGSKYKQTLARLQSGDRITMFGPALNFTLENAPQSVVFLAQGIGITPFRSMLLANKASKSPAAITLVHSDGTDPTYGQLTRTLADASHYPTSPAEFTATLTTVIAADQNARFYLSGSPGFVRATKKTLRDAGVLRAQVRTDTYWGY